MYSRRSDFAYDGHFLLVSGKIRTDRIAESIEPDDIIHSDDERSSIPSWVKDPESDEERV